MVHSVAVTLQSNLTLQIRVRHFGGGGWGLGRGRQLKKSQNKTFKKLATFRLTVLSYSDENWSFLPKAISAGGTLVQNLDVITQQLEKTFYFYVRAFYTYISLVKLPLLVFWNASSTAICSAVFSSQQRAHLQEDRSVTQCSEVFMLSYATDPFNGTVERHLRGCICNLSATSKLQRTDQMLVIVLSALAPKNSFSSANARIY